MSSITREIVRDIKYLEIDCPDCKYMYDDDQYTCTTCWCEGGNGKNNVFSWLRDHPEILKEK